MNRIARFANRHRKLTFAAIATAYGVGFYFAPMIAAGVLVVDLGLSAYLFRVRTRSFPVVGYWNLSEGFLEEE